MNQNPQTDMELAMFAAMVGGQLRQVDKSMIEKSKTHGNAAKIDPYMFLPGRTPAANSNNLRDLSQHTWYAPSEEEVMSAVPEPAGLSSSTSLPGMPVSSVAAPKAAAPRVAAAPSAPPSDDLIKVLKSIDKTLKTISKTIKTVWLQPDNQAPDDESTSR